MDMTFAAQAMSSLKATIDVAQSMIGLSNASAINTKVLELQHRMLEAQQAMFAANDDRAALIERVGALEAEAARLKD